MNKMVLHRRPVRKRGTQKVVGQCRGGFVGDEYRRLGRQGGEPDGIERSRGGGTAQIVSSNIRYIENVLVFFTIKQINNLHGYNYLHNKFVLFKLSVSGPV